MSLTINPTNKVLGTPTPSEFVINVQSTSDWSASTEANWIQFTPSSGTSGNATITATTGENKYDTRSGYLNFSNTQGDSASCEIQHTGLCPATVTRCGVTGDTWVNLPETEFETGAWKIRLDNVTFSKNAKSGSTLFSLNMGYYGQPDIEGIFWIGLNDGVIGIYSYRNFYPFSGTYESYIANETIEMSRDEGIVIGGTKVCDMGLQLYGGGDYVMTLFAKNAYGLDKVTANMDIITIGAVSVFDGEGNLVYKFVPKTSNSLSDIYYCNLKGDMVSTKGGSGYTKPVELSMETSEIKIGNSDCHTLYMGDGQVDKAYFGGNPIIIDEMEYITSGAGLSEFISNCWNFMETGIPFKTDTSLRFEGIWRGYEANEGLLGSRWEPNSNFYCIVAHRNENDLWVNDGYITLRNQTITSGETFSYDSGNYYLKNNINGNIITGTTQETIEGCRTLKVYYDVIFFKRLRIWEGDTLVFDAQPIKNPFKNSDAEKLIFYDDVSKRLFLGFLYEKNMFG